MARGENCETPGTVAPLRPVGGAARRTLFSDRYKIGPPVKPPPVGNEAHRRRLEQYARARARDRRIGVRFGDSGSFTDMKGNIVIDVTQPNKGDDVDRYFATLGLLSHELWHERITARSVWEEFVESAKSRGATAEQEWAGHVKMLRSMPEFAQYSSLREDAYRAHQMAIGFEAERLAPLRDALGRFRSPNDPGYGEAKQELDEAEKLHADLLRQQQDADKAAQDILNKNPKMRKLMQERDDARREMMRIGQEKDFFNIVEDGRIEEHCREHEPLEYRKISMLNRVFPRVPETHTIGEGDPEAQVQTFPCPDGYIPVDASGDELPVVDGPDGVRRVVLQPGTELPVWTDRPLDPKRQLRAALLAEAIPEFSALDKELHPDVRACLIECEPHIDSAVRDNCRNAWTEAQSLIEICDRHNMLPNPEDPQQNQPQGDGGDGEGEPQGGGGMGDPGDGSGRGARQVEIEDSGGTGDRVADASGGKADEEKGEDGGGISKEQREENARQNKGSVADSEVEEERKRAEQDIKRGQSRDQSDQRKAAERGEVDGSRWQTPSNESITGHREIKPSYDPSLPPYLNRFGSQLAAQLEELKDQRRGPERHLRAGRLERKRLASAVAGNDRVFRRPGEEVELDIACEVVLDLSGSMGSYRRQLEEAAVTTHLAMRQLNVPHGIWGFDSNGRADANHYQLMDGEQAQGLSQIARGGFGGGGTPTREAISFAAARLGRRQEASRLMLVFTDGEPTSGDPTPMVEAARRDGQIVIGCLFSSDGGHGLDQRMREIFGDDFVSIDSIDRMPRVLGARLKQMMRSGSRRR